MRDDRHYYCALNYIHFNPVKHGYVSDPYDWPWGSLQNYDESMGRDWLLEKMNNYPSGDLGKGWDE